MVSLTGKLKLRSLIKFAILVVLFCCSTTLLFTLIRYHDSHLTTVPDSSVPIPDEATIKSPVILKSDRILPPGVIVKAEGGLGNQLFKYASSYGIARKFNVPLYLVMPSNSSGYKSNRESSLKNPSTRKFLLDLFDLPMGEWIDENLSSWDAHHQLKVNCEAIFYDKITQAQADTKLIINADYCHAEKYFENFASEVKNGIAPQLDFQTSVDFLTWRSRIEKLQNSVPVAVHIRRGDYGIREHWITPISYYESAIELMRSNLQEKDKAAEFFIFSDDIDYVKHNLFLKRNLTRDDWENQKFHFVSDKNGVMSSFEEFILMTLCHSIVISNSTYSWWAAYLIKESTDKIVIGPKFHPKFLDHVKDKHHRDFKKFMWTYKYTKDWIQLDPYGGIGMR
jgi:hypothetical protein